MAAWVPAAITAGASLLGGKMSAGASAKQAKAQMEFQERMSNTAYQRAADDLEAAGLNRILALGSPASTPGGAMGQVPNFGSAMAEGANAGINLATSAQAISKQKQEVNKIIQETKNLTEQERKIAAQADVMEAIAPILKQAGNNFNNLLEMMTDGNFVKYIYEAAKGAAKEELEVTAKVMAEWFNQAEENILDWFERMADVNKRINLGDGRVN